MDATFVTSSEADDRYLGFGNTSAVGGDGQRCCQLDGGLVTFPDAGSPTTMIMMISFGLPPGREVGRPFLVRIPLMGPPDRAFVPSAGGVVGSFAGNGRFPDPGRSVVGAPDGVIQLGPDPPGERQRYCRRDAQPQLSQSARRRRFRPEATGAVGHQRWRHLRGPGHSGGRILARRPTVDASRPDPHPEVDESISSWRGSPRPRR